MSSPTCQYGIVLSPESIWYKARVGSVAKIRRLSEFNDALGFLVLAAPDNFPQRGSFGSDQKKNLLLKFQELEDGFHFVEEKITDPAVLAHLRQLMKDSLTAYQQGDKKKGAHLLQDIQDIVFPNRFKEYE